RANFNLDRRTVEPTEGVAERRVGAGCMSPPLIGVLLQHFRDRLQVRRIQEEIDGLPDEVIYAIRARQPRRRRIGGRDVLAMVVQDAVRGELDDLLESLVAVDVLLPAVELNHVARPINGRPVEPRPRIWIPSCGRTARKPGGPGWPRL